MYINEESNKLQQKVEDIILHILLKESITKITLDDFYELFIEYCDTDLSIFHIRIYLLNLVCKDILIVKNNIFRFKLKEDKYIIKNKKRAEMR